MVHRKMMASKDPSALSPWPSRHGEPFPLAWVERLHKGTITLCALKHNEYAYIENVSVISNGHCYWKGHGHHLI